MTSSTRTIVCGAGVIGSSIAYFLARRGVEVLIVDRSDVASAASGKAGGFLARDWCDGTVTEQLCQLSFDLHQELADTLDGAQGYGYRPMSAYSVAIPNSLRGLHAAHEKETQWLDDGCFVRGKLGDVGNTAQVNPALFTKTMLAAAVEHGATFVKGTVNGISTSNMSEAISGVSIDGETVEAKNTVFAMGPWTTDAENWTRIPGIDSIKGDSLILRPRGNIPAHALFIDYENANGEWESPELFPRPDGTVYVCAESDPEPLDENPEAVTASAGATTKLLEIAAAVSPALKSVVAENINGCHRPVARDGLPVVGPVQDLQGAWIATGHGPWGILNAPATALVMSELICDGVAKSVDLRSFWPNRDLSDQIDNEELAYEAS